MAKKQEEETAFTSPEFAAETAEIKARGGDLVQVDQTYVPVDFADAIRYLEETGEIIEFEGSPWHPVNKRHLVGMPFVIMDIRVNEDPAKQKYGVPWVNILAVTAKPVPLPSGMGVTDHVVINDGSTGIANQIRAFLDRYPEKGKRFVVKAGLHASDYEVEGTDPDGNPIMLPATTYYIS